MTLGKKKIVPEGDAAEEKKQKKPKGKKVSPPKERHGRLGKSWKRQVEEGLVEPEVAATDISADDDDEIITPTTDLQEEDVMEGMPAKSAVTAVPAFKEGIVHPVFETAVNAHLPRNEETAVFMSVMRTTHLVNGVFVGDIVTRPSFVKRAKGSVLM